MHGPITSVTEADAARYERREAEKRGGGQEEQEGHQGHQGSAGQEGHQGQEASGGHDGSDWPRGPRPSAACRVNLSAAFDAVEAVEADRREEVEAVEADRREEVETEWSAHAAALDS